MIRIGRKRDQRRLLIRNLATSVILYESIVTSPAKARMVQPLIDRIMTIAKSDDSLTARRRLLAILLDENGVNKVLSELTLRYQNRTSGFTHRFNLPPRSGDGGEQVILQLVDAIQPALKQPASAPTADKHEGHDHA